MEILSVLFALLRFEMDGTGLCDDIKNAITIEILPALFKLSKKHDLAHLVGDALDKNGLLPDNLAAKKRFLQERNMAIYRVEQIHYEYEQICTVLEKNKIPFIPLKGAVVREYYPELWMRTSCDIDILVKEESLSFAVETIKKELSYSVPSCAGVHDISLISPGGIHLELHFTLNENIQSLDNALCLAWDYAIPIDGFSFRYRHTNEFLYFHIIAHTAYHLIAGGGCGLRPLLDIWIMQKFMPYTNNTVLGLCEKAGLLVFYDKMQKLSQSCMQGAGFTEEEGILLDFIMRAGMYGDVANRVAIQQVKKKGKLRLLLSRIFLPYKEMIIYYPTVKKYKILFPFYQLFRWIRLLFGKNSKNFRRELGAGFKATEEKRNNVVKILKILEL